MAYIPYVVEQSNHGERSYDIFSRLLNDRIILLHDQVNSATASVVVAQLLYLEGQDPDKDIYLYINSPGGSVSDIFVFFVKLKMGLKVSKKGERESMKQRFLSIILV